MTKKQFLTVMDKFSGALTAMKREESLVGWANVYFKLHVVGAPEKTMVAKRKDMARFLGFFKEEVGHDQVDGWTPAVTRQFQSALRQSRVSGGGKDSDPLKATTVNRVMATIRHFGRWLHKQRPLLAGNPMEGVKDLALDAPDWNGLTNRQIMRLKSACEQRLKACGRRDQNPKFEAAVFFVLLNTGLRESELVGLDLENYHHKGFHEVRRKGSRISKKVPVPGEARLYLDGYLEHRREGGGRRGIGDRDGGEVRSGSGSGSKPLTGPIFVNRYGARLAAQDVARICARLAHQANAHLGEEERFRLTPHMLRHTFLKRVADKFGVHVAQQMSGNVSTQEIFRYTRPSQEEMDQTAEEVFG